MALMKSLFALSIISFCFVIATNAFAAQSDAQLTSAVRQIFQAKCAACHSPDSGKRRAIAKWADWRDLDELKRKYVAEDFSLIASTLWDSLTEENPKARMPPASAKGGALTNAELDTVKRWIESGAPVVDEAHAGGTRSVASSAQPEQSRSRDSGTTLQSWLGKFHPVVVHFPIALLLLAALGELANLFRAGTWHPSAARFCLWIAAVSAIVAAVFGFFAEESDSFNEKIGGVEIVEIHKWLGIATACLAVVVAILCELNFRAETPRKKMSFRLALFAAAIVVGLTGYFGGLLTFGSGHFSWSN